MNLLTTFLATEAKLKNLKCVLTSFGEKDFLTRGVHKRKTKYYSNYYKILELTDDADQDSVRRAYINLCKKYHPDSGNPAANPAKFQEIDDAYKMLQNKFAEERWNVNEGIGEYGLYYDESKKKSEEEEQEEEEIKIFDIKHNAPQHRQYLSFGGVGSGMPSQREKQYANYKRMNAIQNVYNHRINKVSRETLSKEDSLVVKDKKEAKKIKTRYGMDRLVEDLIQESMAKGEFENLKGAGKPLPESNYNPFVDLVTHKMNQVMIENGFVPEWITLQKEIGDAADLIKETLSKERRNLGALPFSESDRNEWENLLGKMSGEVKILNKKIDKFNLVVPILDKQMLHFDLAKESDKILENVAPAPNVKHKKKPGAQNKKSEYSDLLSIFSNGFWQR